jgi:serine/threonine protein kinase
VVQTTGAVASQDLSAAIETGAGRQRALSVLKEVQRACPLHEVTLTADGMWVYASPPRGRLQRHGWKLHVSAGPAPVDTLGRVLDVLSRTPVHFKVLASTELLIELNGGNFGLSQIGKFITVYPPSPAAAVRLADFLDAATVGCVGPAVTSDRRLRANSVVYYRYGAFQTRPVMTPMGRCEPIIKNPGGGWYSLSAKTFYTAPAWKRSPFDAAVSCAAITPLPIDYTPIRLLAESARGGTYLALDTKRLRRCVVKEARSYVAADANGCDARHRLEHEHVILRRIAALGVAPQPYAFESRPECAYLVMQDVAAPTLQSRLIGDITRFGVPTRKKFAAQAIALAQAITNLHTHALAHRDLKPTNILCVGRAYKLLDFELALSAGETPRWGTGTPGYMSPQQACGASADLRDDVYSLGAVLFFLATGCDLSQASSDPLHNAAALEHLNGNLDDGLWEIIRQCRELRRERRQPNAAALTRQLERWSRAQQTGKRRRHANTSRPAADRVRDMHRLVERQLQEVTERPSRGELFLNDGVAGAVLVLSELVRLGLSSQNALLAASAFRLIQDSRSQPRPLLPGFYVGQAGIAWAVLRAGAVAGEERLIKWARQQLAWCVAQPCTSPDVFHGAAGRLWIALQFRQLLKVKTLDGAIRRLRKQIIRTEGEHGWEIPVEYGGLGGDTYFGYAHGAAGIADVLLSASVTVGAKTHAGILRRARTLQELADRHLNAGRGRRWPVGMRDRTVAGPMWCHGSAGIGLFFLNLWKATADHQWLDTAESAGRTVLETGRWLGPTQCHGLSGSIEFLLDLYQATRVSSWLRGAQVIGDTLLASIEPASTSIEKLGLGYMVGTSGIAAAVTRLNAPDTLHRFILAPPL